jgi:hypothetical protein
LFAAILAGAVTTGGPTGASQTATEQSALFTSPTAITVTNSAAFTEDMGVIDLTAGYPMTRGATATAAGVYSVAAGVYSFNAGDTGHTFLIRYRYGITLAGSKTVTYSNQLMGSGTTFIFDAFNNYNGDNLGFRFPATKFTKLSMPLKSEDYTIGAIEGEAFAASDGTVAVAYVAD